MAQSVTAYLCCNGAARALDWYAEVFDGVELSRIADDKGRLGHAEMRIGESVIFLSDEWEELRIHDPAHFGGNSVSLVIEVADADASYARALGAGASVDRPVRDEAFGRAGWLYDPWGHHWCVVAPAAGPAK